MSSKEFAGKTALVSGGSRGIGRAVAIKLAQHGADIAVNFLSRDEDAQAAKELVEKEGVRCVLVKGDVSKPADVEAMAQKARLRVGAHQSAGSQCRPQPHREPRADFL